MADGCGCSGCQERRLTTMVVTVYDVVADGVGSYLVLVGWHAKARGYCCGVSLVRERRCRCWFVAVMVAVAVAVGCDGYPLMLLTVSVLVGGSDGGRRCG